MKNLQHNKLYYIISGVFFAGFGLFWLFKPPSANGLLNKQFFIFFGIIMLALSAMRLLTAFKIIRNERNK